jgi:hypothetical protein
VKLLRAAFVVVGLAIGAAGLLILMNPAPDVPPASAGGAANALPYVVKLHARWCPVCIVTKSAWADIESAYKGRVRFVVFDFTSHATTEESRARARQLGLEQVFDEYVGETGTVLVIDGASREVKHSLHGIKEQAEYNAAIDTTLAGVTR